MENTSFQPVAWANATNIYEINVRQYTPEGTFQAFSKSLRRLQDMGVGILWFMPITPIAVDKRLGTLGSYYACADYTSINPEFGTLDDFKNLVHQAHKLGMKVIIDWVANHTGYGHTWTVTHPDFYKKNHLGEFYDPHGWEDVIDLNYDNPLLRTTMIAAMQFWVDECDIDGFRCDMAHLVPLDFWIEARTALDSTKKLFWMAECEVPEYHPTFDASYRWNFLHGMENFWKKAIDLNELYQLLQDFAALFPASALNLMFTSNHDENSHSGSEYERLGDAAKCFALLCATWKGTPLIYSGQEAANKKRLNFFDKDCIDWGNGYPLHDFYKKLLTLHSNNPAMLAGDDGSSVERISTDNDHRLFAFLRKKEAYEVLVFINFSSDYYWAHLTDEKIGGNFNNIFSNEINDITKNRYFEMRPWDFYVYEKVI
jgi:glycosidase